MATDPPYGVEYDPTWRNAAGVSDTARTGRVLNDHRADWREAWALSPGEQARIVQALVERVTVGPTGADIRLRVEGLAGLVRDLRPAAGWRDAA